MKKNTNYFRGTRINRHNWSNSDGKSLTKLSFEELNQKMDNFTETIKRLVEEIITNPGAIKKLAKTTYEIHVFSAKVFLETEFAVEFKINDGFVSGEVVQVENGSPQYQELLKKMSAKLEETILMLKMQGYIITLSDYKSQLDEN